MVTSIVRHENGIVTITLDLNNAVPQASGTGKTVTLARFSPNRAPVNIPGTDMFITDWTVYRKPRDEAERQLCAARQASAEGQKALKADAARKLAAKARKSA